MAFVVCCWRRLVRGLELKNNPVSEVLESTKTE